MPAPRVRPKAAPSLATEGTVTESRSSSGSLDVSSRSADAPHST
jgi:hypothetical protein